MSFIQEYFSSLGEHLREELAIGNIGHAISEAIVPRTVFTLSIAGQTLRVTDAVVATWIVMLATFILGWFFGRKREHVPTTKRQVIAEMLVDTMLGLCRNVGMNDAQAEKVAPFVGTIA